MKKMIKVKKDLVGQNVISARSYGKGNPVNSITVHQTGNRNKGANAKMHSLLQKNMNPRKASWQYQGDDKEIIQSFNDDIRCWTNTDGKKTDGGNMTTLSIELCVNEDGDYLKTIENGAKFVAMKLIEHKLTISDVKRHFDWYNKFCPEQLMRGYLGVSWNDFIDKVRHYLNNENVEHVDLLKVDGFMGRLTISQLQRYFETIIDGVISRPSLVIRSLQRWLNTKGYGLVVDGFFGPRTILALQKFFGTTQDAFIDDRYPSQVVKELQRRLNNGNLDIKG